LAAEKKTKIEVERDRELSKELADSFPASDPPSITQPGGGFTGAEGAGKTESRLEKIRERAHAIWLDEGQAHGRDLEHWKQAEGEIDREGQA
jgi:hypothetical protein